MKKTNRLKKVSQQSIPWKLILKFLFWFSIGVCITSFFVLSFYCMLFQQWYTNRIYPGITINKISFSGATIEQVQRYFDNENQKIQNTVFIFQKDEQIATISAAQLHLGYDSNTIAQQAFSIGRSPYPFSNILTVAQGYLGIIQLPVSYVYNNDELTMQLASMIRSLHKEAIDAIFVLKNNKVADFRTSEIGQDVDTDGIKKQLVSTIPLLTHGKAPTTISIPIFIKKVAPEKTLEQINSLGIKEVIGTGTSLYQHSSPSRAFNIAHATEKFYGVLVKPDEAFSFVKTLGDISAITGYQQAYVIQDGKTVLGDGGGVCQVSTTFFRALLNAGLPIIQRHAHAYRVGYYEEDSPPGLDATVFYPNVDLQFKNDTGKYILIEPMLDAQTMRLSFTLYGTNDGRISTLTNPVVLNQTSAPEPLYQDDPTLPAGVIKQIDFAAPGAQVTFSRQVTRNGGVILSDTFTSNYQPWQAKFLRGTGPQQ